RTRDIFIARLVSAMSANLLISGILVAAVLGVGVGAGAPSVYFPLAVVLIVDRDSHDHVAAGDPDEPHPAVGAGEDGARRRGGRRRPDRRGTVPRVEPEHQADVRPKG